MKTLTNFFSIILLLTLLSSCEKKPYATGPDIYVEDPGFKVVGYLAVRGFDEIDNLENLLKKFFPNGYFERQKEKEKDFTFGGDFHDISLSFKKIGQVLGFKGAFTVVDGIKEVKDALDHGIVSDPHNQKYRNALPFIVQ